MRRSKYGAQITYVDGIRFHSKGEARRWQELKLLEKAGEIAGLGRQRRYALRAGREGITVGHYVADFDYTERCTGWVVEDYKGIITDLARWKLRHFEAEYGIKVRITGPAARKRAA